MNDIIHQIYATALDADEWPKLLVALNQGLQSNEDDSFPHQVKKEIIRSHVTQAIEIHQKQADTDDHRHFVESSLSILPIAFYVISEEHLSHGIDSEIVQPLNYKARILLPELKQELIEFIRGLTDISTDNNKHIYSKHIIYNEKTYLFLELPVEQLSIDGKKSVVLVTSSHQNLFNDSILFEHWKFSRKETAICKLLLEGESIQSISKRNSRSIHTIRSQVKAIFQKSGLHSQIELIRHFYMSPYSIASIKEQTGSFPKSKLVSYKMKLPDGRTLSWAEHGDKTGTPVLLCHTMHQSRFLRHPDEEISNNLKIRIITPDRPGYGGSDPIIEGSIEDWPNDIALLMQHLKIDKISLLGIGIGAVFALKTAEMLGDKIIRTTCINLPNYIKPVPSYDYTNLVSFAACKLARHSPKLLLQVLQLAGRDLFFKNPVSILNKFYPCKGSMDKKVLQSKDFQRQITEDFSESNKQGFGKALISEINYLLNHKRIFDPAMIKTPVSCWYKNNNQNPSIKHIKRFVNELPDGNSYILDTEEDFIVYHEWKNYLYQSAFGTLPPT